MKTQGLGLLGIVWLVGCGGSGDATIDGGGNDGSSNDGTVSDTSTGDVVVNDTGTDTGSDAGSNDASDSGAFTPLNVPGLVLWLEANVSSSITTMTGDSGGAVVTEWADQTTHHNNATGSTTLLVRDPTVKSSAINSLPAIHFNQGLNQGVGNMLTIAENGDGSLDWGTGDFYVAIVGDFDNVPTSGLNLGVGNFFSKQNTFGWTGTYTGVLFYGNVPPMGGGSSTPPSVGALFGTSSANSADSVSTTTAYNNGNPHIFSLRRRTTALDLLIDGTSVKNSTTTVPDVTTSTEVRIGADGDDTFVRLDGDIGEIIAVKGALMMGDEANIIAYLKAKWATP